MERSVSTASLTKALFRARRTMAAAERNRSSEFFDWADLSSVLAACEGPLRRSGILHVWVPIDLGVSGIAAVETRLVHVKSQEWIAGVTRCHCGTDRIEYAAAITALRRIGLACMVGLVQAESESPRFSADGKNEAQRIVESRKPQTVGCPVGTCGARFKSRDDLDAHYAKEHVTQSVQP